MADYPSSLTGGLSLLPFHSLNLLPQYLDKAAERQGLVVLYVITEFSPAIFRKLRYVVF